MFDWETNLWRGLLVKVPSQHNPFPANSYIRICTWSKRSTSEGPRHQDDTVDSFCALPPVRVGTEIEKERSIFDRRTFRWRFWTKGTNVPLQKRRHAFRSFWLCAVDRKLTSLAWVCAWYAAGQREEPLGLCASRRTVWKGQARCYLPDSFLVVPGMAWLWTSIINGNAAAFPMGSPIFCSLLILEPLSALILAFWLRLPLALHVEQRHLDFLFRCKQFVSREEAYCPSDIIVWHDGSRPLFL